MIRVENLCKSFGDSQVLKDVSVTLNKGECVAIIGPSGTGKSVFLSCLNGLLSPESGKVFIKDLDITSNETDINAVRRGMGMVYQDFNLFAHLTVMENIILAPTKILKLSRDDAVEQARALLETVGLLEKENAYPKELSGGQQQRIAIARAMAMHPEIMLFDEPTSALDPTMVGEVLAVIRSFAKAGITMIIVTHEMEFAKEVSQRVLYMDDMGIYEQGTPQEIFETPKKLKTISFIEKLKVLEYEVSSKSFDFIALCAKVELFCVKYQLGKKNVYNINLCLEEIIFYLLKNDLAEHIGITVTFSDKTKQAVLDFTYNGIENNIMETAKTDLGISVLRAMIQESKHWFTGENHLHVRLRA